MPGKDSFLGVVRTNKSFLLLLIGQGISNLGDAFQLIAVTEQLLKMTGSGLSTAFGIICAPAPSILLSPFAGSLGDKYNSKTMLVIIDLLRAAASALFILGKNLWITYALLLTLSSLSVLYRPPGKKLVVTLLKENELITGNSILSGVSGVSFLLGPVVAGVIVEYFGASIAFIINSISFIVSAVMIISIKQDMGRNKQSRLPGENKPFGVFRGMREGFYYSRSVFQVKEIIIICTVVSVGIASVNVAFYPYAFDILKVTSKGWGFMLSVFYGTNLIGMFITIYMKKQIQRNPLLFIYLPLLVVSAVWFGYGIAGSLMAVILLQFVEGVVEAVCGTVMGTRLQAVSKKNFVARVTGVNDILSSVGKLAGIAAAYILLRYFKPNYIFLVNSLILFLFVAYSLFSKGFAVVKYYVKANKNR